MTTRSVDQKPNAGILDAAAASLRLECESFYRMLDGARVEYERRTLALAAAASEISRAGAVDDPDRLRVLVERSRRFIAAAAALSTNVPDPNSTRAHGALIGVESRLVEVLDSITRGTVAITSGERDGD